MPRVRWGMTAYLSQDVGTNDNNLECLLLLYIFISVFTVLLLVMLGKKSLEKITFCTDCLFLNTFDSVLYFIVYPCIILL